MHDLIIIGGGPAGVSAGVYASRKKIKALVIANSFSGRSVVSDNIENWIGTQSISGLELAQKMEQHLRAQKDIEIKEDKVAEIAKIDGGFLVKTDSGEAHQTKTILICTGGKHRLLNVIGEEKFIGKGVAFCSTCDAPFFKNKDVAVVGAGNAGLEAVIDLMSYASKIYLLVHGDKIKGDALIREKVINYDKVQVIYNTETTEIIGDSFVSGLKYLDTISREAKEIDVQGVFVTIGAMPNSDIVRGLVDLNERGEIIIDYRTGQASLKGIWAAGDVTDSPYKQNNIAVGDAARAVLDIYTFLYKGR